MEDVQVTTSLRLQQVGLTTTSVEIQEELELERTQSLETVSLAVGFRRFSVCRVMVKSLLDPQLL